MSRTPSVRTSLCAKLMQDSLCLHEPDPSLAKHCPWFHGGPAYRLATVPVGPLASATTQQAASPSAPHQPMPIRATTGPTNKIAGRSLSSHGGALIYTHLQAGMRSMWNRSGGLTQLASRLRNPASPAEPGVRSSPHYMRDGSGC
jgi:hypothetical protein